MTTLKQEIHMIRQAYKLGNSYEELSQKYSTFKYKKPHLFDMICSDDCDESILEFMLSKYDSVQSGNASQHDASVHIGSVLVDKYVKSKLDKD